MSSNPTNYFFKKPNKHEKKQYNEQRIKLAELIQHIYDWNYAPTLLTLGKFTSNRKKIRNSFSNETVHRQIL